MTSWNIWLLSSIRNNDLVLDLAPPSIDQTNTISWQWPFAIGHCQLIIFDWSIDRGAKSRARSLFLVDNSDQGWAQHIFAVKGNRNTIKGFPLFTDLPNFNDVTHHLLKSSCTSSSPVSTTTNSKEDIHDLTGRQVELHRVFSKGVYFFLVLPSHCTVFFVLLICSIIFKIAGCY